MSLYLGGAAGPHRRGQPVKSLCAMHMARVCPHRPERDSPALQRGLRAAGRADISHRFEASLTELCGEHNPALSPACWE